MQDTGADMCVHLFNSIEACRQLHEKGERTFLELGPHPVLLGMGAQCLPKGEGLWLPSLRRGQDDWKQMIESLGELYVRGVKVSWNGFDSDYQRSRVPLPTYPFQKKRYWIESSKEFREPTPGFETRDHSVQMLHPLLGSRLRTPKPLFELPLHVHTTSWLKDHCVFGRVVVPATAYLEDGPCRYP